MVAPAVTAPTCTAGTVGPPVTQPSCSARQPVSITVPLAGPITADALTLPSPYFITLEIVAAPSNSNPRSTAPTTGQVSIAQPAGNATPASVTLTYSPPSAWVNNAAQSASNGDSFTYRFDVYAGNPTDPSPVLVSRSAVGTITVSVPPLPGASFASNVVTGISGGPCVACHSPSAPQYVVVTGPPSYASSWNDSGTANGTLYDVYTGGPSSSHPCPQSVSGGADTTDTNYKCANVDNVSNSLLLLKPRNPGAPIYHFGGTQLTTADALYQTLWMWIFDGAWND